MARPPVIPVMRARRAVPAPVAQPRRRVHRPVTVDIMYQGIHALNVDMVVITAPAIISNINVPKLIQLK